MKQHIVLALKGAGMGAANVIPGVSGGTIALLAGIYEKLIDSIKSFDITAVRLLFAGKIRQLTEHVSLGFLAAVFLGAVAGIFSLARVLDYLFVNYPVYVWAFFFGLILGSVYFIAARICRWSAGTLLMFAAGTFVAVSVSVLRPAAGNDAYWYLFVCGVVATCSMILPGLSGSFVLILMGNYQLVMIDAVNNLNLRVLIPLGLGAAFGLLAFSRFLSWIFKRYRNQTLALLTGFVLGSLSILWPWKDSFDADGNILAVNRFGAFIDANGRLMHDVKVFGFRQVLPESFDLIALAALLAMLLGIVLVLLLEKLSKTRPAR